MSKDNKLYVTSRTPRIEYKAYDLFVVLLLKTFNSSSDEPQFDSSQGTGTWAYFGVKMSLTYRGLKYNQQKAAAEKQHVQLTYRGKSYQS